MFKNFILLTYRHFVRSPLTSFIELFGMTAGLTVFILILLWVSNEISYDSFNEKADRIYRIEAYHGSFPNAKIKTIVAPILTENVPEVEKVVRIVKSFTDHDIYTINKYDTKDYFEVGNAIITEKGFFDIFSFKFLAGNPETSLKTQNTCVLTESFAKIIFGDIDVIGEHVFNRDGQMYSITGVIKDVHNFHIPFDIIYTLIFKHNYSDTFIGGNHPAYVLVNPQHDTGLLEKKITSVVLSHLPDSYRISRIEGGFNYKLRPLKDIYLNGGSAKETTGYSVHGDSRKVIAYASIAAFTLLLACINFINLNSAKSFERAKEVGIKKVSGASRVNVFFQFLGEVMILCLLSLILALIFTHSILPWFNNLMNTTLFIGQLLTPLTFASMALGLLFISLISGGFPALYMSSFQPVQVVKGLPSNTGKGFDFKKVNLVIQFAVTTILLIGTITIFRQINYMKNAELGFSKEHRVVFPFDGTEFADKLDVVKNSLLLNPNVLSVSNSAAIPGRNSILNAGFPKLTYEGVDYNLNREIVDEDYLKTLDLNLVEGRFFDKNRVTDRHGLSEYTFSILLNESAVKLMGLENPIGAKINSGYNRKMEVIGVLKDFHLNSLNHPIRPMYFVCWAFKNNQMIVNISSTDMAATTQFIESEIEKITKDKPTIKFFDDEFDKQYRSDEQFSELVGYFAALAILIACMGLLGVATHAIKLRIKEVGIRKIMGATPFQILNLLMGSFVKIIILSVVLAVPIGWVIMNNWLSNYAYRTDLNWWVFAIACGLTVAIAAFTIIWQSWRASSVNPARLIRYE